MTPSDIYRINTLLGKKLYTETIAELVKLIEKNITTIPPMELLITIGKLYEKSKNHLLAERLHKNAIQNMNLDNDTKALLFVERAKIAFYQGQYSKALCNLKKMNQISDCQKREKLKICANTNSGLIFLKLGDFEKAIKCFESSFKIATDNDFTISVNRSIIAMALTYAIQNDYSKAFSNINKIDINYLKKNYPYDHCVYYAYKGHIEFLHGLNTGNKQCIKKALKTLNHALKLACDFTVDGTCEGQTCRLLAEVYLHLEDYEKAHEYATRSFRISRLINERYEVGVVYWIFGRLAEIDNDNKRAEFNYHMSKKILTEIGAKYELERLHKVSVEVE